MSDRIGPLSGYTLVSIDEDYHGSSTLAAIKRDILGGIMTAPSITFEGDKVNRYELKSRRLYAVNNGLSIVDFIRNDRTPNSKLEPDNYVTVERVDDKNAEVVLVKQRGEPLQYSPKTSFQYLID